MGAFATIVEQMAAMDIFQLFFPWLLVVSVTYGVLEKSNIFSGDASVNGTIAFSVAFFSVGGAYYFLPEGILTSFAAALTFSLFGVLGVMILAAVAGFDLENLAGGEGPPLMALLVGVLFLLSFIGAFSFQADIGALLGNVENTFQEVVMPILVLVFLLFVVALTVGGGD